MHVQKILNGLLNAHLQKNVTVLLFDNWIIHFDDPGEEKIPDGCSSYVLIKYRVQSFVVKKKKQSLEKWTILHVRLQMTQLIIWSDWWIAWVINWPQPWKCRTKVRPTPREKPNQTKPNFTCFASGGLGCTLQRAEDDESPKHLESVRVACSHTKTDDALHSSSLSFYCGEQSSPIYAVLSLPIRAWNHHAACCVCSSKPRATSDLIDRSLMSWLGR